MKKRLRRGSNRLLRGGDSRLRATWRILFAFALTLAGALAGSLLVQTLPVPELVAPPVVHLFATLGVLVTLVVLIRYADRRPVAWDGFTNARTWWTEALLGSGFGLGLVGLAFGFSYQRGTVAVTDTFSAGTAGSLAVGFVVAILGWILVGLWEETLFRGVLLGTAAEGLAARGLAPASAVLGGLVSSSLVYGFIHGPLGSNPETVSLLYALLMTAVMGGLFGLAYLLTGRLALPIGLHTGINLAEHNIFLGPPDAAVPAVVRVEYAVGGGHVQFQSLDPVVVLPVFAIGYTLVFGWVYLREGAIAPGRLADDDLYTV